MMRSVRVAVGVLMMFRHSAHAQVAPSEARCYRFDRHYFTWVGRPPGGGSVFHDSTAGEKARLRRDLLNGQRTSRIRSTTGYNHSTPRSVTTMSSSMGTRALAPPHSGTLVYAKNSNESRLVGLIS